MTRTANRRSAALLFGAILLTFSGCAPRPALVVDAFPPASAAYPWVLDGVVWRGTFDQARGALGRDAALFDARPEAPVWIARYGNETEPERRLTVRAIGFDSADAAATALRRVRRALADPLDLGDEGAWTEGGVVFRRGRLLVDLFGESASWSAQLQAATVATYIDRKLTRAMAEAPQ